MGSKTTVKTNETATNTPPQWAEPGLTELGQRITSIIPTMPGPQYTGDFVAPSSTYEAAMPGQLTALADFMRSMTPGAMGALDASTTPVNFGMEGAPQVGQYGDYDPSGVLPVITAAMQPAFRQLTESVLPSLQSSGMESGAYSSGRARDVLPNMAIGDTMRTVGELASGISYQDFSDFENRRLQAYGLDTERGLGEAGTLSQRLSLFPDLLDTVLRTQAGATDTEAAAAGYDRQLRQQEIDNTLAQFDYNVRYPFQGLDVAAALLGNLAQPWGSRTTQGTQTQSQGGLGQIVQGALGLGMGALGMPGGLGSLFSRKPAGGAINVTGGAMPAWLGG